MNLSVFLMVVVLMTHGTMTEETSNSNELTASSSPRDLDINLRKALLKALNELENEESENHSDKLVERAPASSFTIYDNPKSKVNTFSKQPGISSIINPIEGMDIDMERSNQSEIDVPLVILQKSEGVQQKPITTFEKENSEIDSNYVEQIITSASNSLTSSDNQLVKSKIGTDLIKTTIKIIANSTIAPTTNQPLTSTEENKVRVHDVQFFSAPLVAAFTVHQDELGLPKKVESIFKQELPSKLDTYFTQNQLIFKEQRQLEDLRQQEILRQQNEKLGNQQQFKLKEVEQEEIILKQNDQNIPKTNENLRKQQEESQQINIHKQKVLEKEILRFNLKQQHKVLSMQQEQLRSGNNPLPFLPITNARFNSLIRSNLQLQQLPTTLSSPVIQRLPITEPVPTIPQLPVKPIEIFNRNVFLKNSVSVLPSIIFDPLVENGKLPLNAQILPVKPPINFNSPIIQTPQFQQFHSLSPFNIDINQLHSLQSVLQPQSNKIFRHESNIGNFVNNKNTDTVFIQQSIQPPPLLSTIPEFFSASNRFLRSNRDTNIHLASLQQHPQQSHRVFRSNPESTLMYPNNLYRHQQKNYELNNLLFNSVALRGRSPEDFNIITNILKLNHSEDQRYANSVRQNQWITNFQKL